MSARPLPPCCSEYCKSTRGTCLLSHFSKSLTVPVTVNLKTVGLKNTYTKAVVLRLSLHLQTWPQTGPAVSKCLIPHTTFSVLLPPPLVNPLALC